MATDWDVLPLALALGGLMSCGSEDGSNPFGDSGASQGSEGSGASGQPDGSAGDDGDGPGSADDGGDDGILLDTQAGDDGDIGPCGCGNNAEWSYIWIANSGQSTVSKVNTRTLLEEGRYLTRPDAAGNPSRTSVSLSGKAVAVANRHGGVVKVWALPELCKDSNGTPGLQTSSGSGDVLPWGEDDCIAWYAEFPDFTTQRPIAWAGGTLNAAECEYIDEKIWTVGCGGGSPGFGGGGGVTVHRLDGDTGTVEDTVAVPDFACYGRGAYGGAVDADGNFWFSHQSGGALAFVDADTLDAQVYGQPNGFWGYGITVDNKGRPWMSGYNNGMGAARFDPDSAQWTVNTEGFLGQAGIQQDAEGRIWVGTWALANGSTAPNGVISLDPETLASIQQYEIPGSTKGVSIDADGYVWAIASGAHKIDPDTGDFETYSGLDGAYTYSDMTGWGLTNVNCNPAG